MSTKKIILDLCGGTGAWSKPYVEKGYDVRNITLPMFNILDSYIQEQCIKLKPHGILAAPPCTQFSFARSRNTNLKKPRDLELGMKLIMACLKIIWKCQFKIEKQSAKKTTLKFWALENPNGFLKYFLGKPAYIFDPWYFGDMYKKRTQLWGWFSKPKQAFFIKPNVPKFGYDKRIKSNPKDRAITPSGFAKAFFEANP